MKDLDERFEKAYTIASSFSEKLPPDIMLKIYAYYKQATSGNIFKEPTGDDSDSIRNAFKLNAWFQLRGVSESEAKKKYIELIELITKQKIV
ncbi:MAG: acyl-CoA-binding protein [Flavobacteriaceae bacterium]|nr:acyl-CoA-binding protein [Flavobacteriaceae bacterium]